MFELERIAICGLQPFVWAPLFKGKISPYGLLLFPNGKCQIVHLHYIGYKKL
jgi:hypothetical protein